MEAIARLFWDSPHALRYGIAEKLYGHDAIARFARERVAVGGAVPRALTRTAITTFGRDFATVNVEYRRHASGRGGRQSQSWARIDGEWRVVAAHVSLLAEGDPDLGKRRGG
jgi:hypothetical protein